MTRGTINQLIEIVDGERHLCFCTAEVESLEFRPLSATGYPAHVLITFRSGIVTSVPGRYYKALKESLGVATQL